MSLMAHDRPRSLSAPTFLVGRDRRGRWVARDEKGLCGGLFVSRAEAVKFALFENGHRQDGVVLVAGFCELDLASGESAADGERRP
jgi:hypothetical protein